MILYSMDWICRRIESFLPVQKTQRKSLDLGDVNCIQIQTIFLPNLTILPTDQLASRLDPVSLGSPPAMRSFQLSTRRTRSSSCSPPGHKASSK